MSRLLNTAWMLWQVEKQILRQYETARRALDENAIREYSLGITTETPEFLALNRAVCDMERRVPWWLALHQWRIDARIERELRYWELMDRPLGWALRGPRAGGG